VQACGAEQQRLQRSQAHTVPATPTPTPTPPPHHTQVRTTSQAALLAQLTALEAAVAAKGGPSARLAGPALSIADVAVAAVLQPLLGGVMGAQAREPFAHSVTWAQGVAQQPEAAKALGGCACMRVHVCMPPWTPIGL